MSDNLFGELVVVGAQDGSTTSPAATAAPSTGDPTVTDSPSPAAASSPAATVVNTSSDSKHSNAGGNSNSPSNQSVGSGSNGAGHAATRPDLNRLYSAAKADTEALVAPLRAQVTQLASQVGTMRGEGRDARRDVLDAVAAVAERLAALDERMARIEAMMVPDDASPAATGVVGGANNNHRQPTANPAGQHAPAFPMPHPVVTQSVNNVTNTGFAQPTAPYNNNNNNNNGGHQMPPQQHQAHQSATTTTTTATAVPTPIRQVTGTVAPTAPTQSQSPTMSQSPMSQSQMSQSQTQSQAPVATAPPAQQPVQVAFDRKLISDAVGLGFSEESVVAALNSLYAAGRPCNDINLVIDTINA